MPRAGLSTKSHPRSCTCSMPMPTLTCMAKGVLKAFPMRPSALCASTSLALVLCTAVRSSAASPALMCCSFFRQAKANAATASVSAGMAVSPQMLHNHPKVDPLFGSLLSLTHSIAIHVPKAPVLLGHQQPLDHLLTHPLAVDTESQHTQAVLVVTGERMAVMPGAWGQSTVVTRASWWQQSCGASTHRMPAVGGVPHLPNPSPGSI